MSMFDFFRLKKKNAKTRILVVDDDPNIMRTLRDRLERNGYDVITASNGKDGLQVALEEKPDVVLLDIIMPIMDGHEMLEALRRQPFGQEPSVIMFTARSQAQDISRANASGIDDYVVKPFDLSELLERIETVIENRKAVAK
jgi:DNA-binding response OmpR family regulator